MAKSVMRQLLCSLIALSIATFLPSRANAWGAAGHRIVALIADNQLTKKARQAISDLLNEDETLASVSTFADQIRNSRPDTRQFHFVDIPKNANDYDPNRDCEPSEKGDCVIAAIDRFKAELSDPNESRGRRRFALKFLVHLIGDMHQPLHCANDDDRGGNDVKVTWFGRSGKGINLHSVWDRLIIEEAGLEEAEFAEALEEGITPQKIQSMQSGTVIEWPLQSHKAARDHAYRIPRNRRLGQRYYDNNFRVVDEQLLRGGLRLASVLNEVFH